MKRKLLLIILAVVLCFPITALALSKSYTDKIAEITGSEIKENKINLYLFHGAECPHCEEERKWLLQIEKDYKDYLEVYYFEVWHDNDNATIMNKVKSEFGIIKSGVPLTVIGDEYFIGFSDAIGSKIENKIKEYAELKNNSNEVKIPILGNIDMKKVSIPLVAVVLGFIDGFNPCAMWILLFLINMLFGMNNKKKAWILGLTFLFISGFVYLLSMLGINFVLGVATIQWMKIAIAIFILIAGIFSLKKYFKIRKEAAGCTVVDSKKRKILITRIRNIMGSKSFIFSLIGIIVFAISVNLIELACSLGFPLIFTEILSINNISGITKILYLLIYIFFYLIDDLVVFAISMITLEATGITNKYNKLCTLVSAIIMIVMGLLLIFKPDWLMLNF
ncbi:MAG: hypothetical protein E7159_01365 [Firmicutes bacterium]|nr:hypothetical protein [Bacillota bacterium]